MDDLRASCGLCNPAMYVAVDILVDWARGRGFDEILAITQGGPGNDTWMAAWYTYKISFQPPFNIGLGAASAYVLALTIGIIAIVYVRTVYRRVEY